LSSLKAGGYECVDYQTVDRRSPVVILRHDVDKDLQAAVAMAELEHSAGVRASYFFLLRSPLYGLLEPAGQSAVRRILHLGHQVGLHCDERRMADAGRDGMEFDVAVGRERQTLAAVVGVPTSSTVSFHNPSAGLFGRSPKGGGYVSAYAPQFTPPAMKYLSDSNAAWREGDPCDGFQNAEWPRVQLLVHPIWWARENRQEPAAVLRDVYDRRARELDEYLSYTNNQWRGLQAPPPRK
jgi:hypothetical protein